MNYNYTAFSDIDYNNSEQDDYNAFQTPERLCADTKHYSGKNFFDYKFGEGKFLVYILRKKLEEGESLNAAITEIHGVELDAPWKEDKPTSERCPCLKTKKTLEKDQLCSMIFPFDKGICLDATCETIGEINRQIVPSVQLEQNK